MPDRDLMEIFDAVLPRLEPCRPGSVPCAGAIEATQYEHYRGTQRAELAIFAGAAAAFGGLAWFLWVPFAPMWFYFALCAPAVGSGLAAMRSYLRLAFNRRLEHALPPGTDAATAQLEDGTKNLIFTWNADALDWNRNVEALRLEVSDWQRFKDVPEARDIEWTEKGSRTRAEGLIAAMRGLASEREALVARRDAIDHDLLRLDARLHRLKASEEAPMLALPAPPEDEPDDE